MACQGLVRQVAGQTVRPQYMSQPPLMFSVTPVMYAACSEARKTTAGAISSGAREPPERDLVDEPLERVGREVVAEHRRVDEAGRDGVDADPRCGVRPRETAGHRDDAALRRVVDDRAAEAAGPPALRAEVDDRAGPPGAPQTLREGAVEEERRLQVDVDLGVPVRLVDLADVVPAAQDGGEMGERDEGADRVLRLRDELVVPATSARSAPRPTWPSPGSEAASAARRVLVEVERGDARAGRRRTRARRPSRSPPAAPVTSTPCPARPCAERLAASPRGLTTAARPGTPRCSPRRAPSRGRARSAAPCSRRRSASGWRRGSTRSGRARR